MAITLHSDRFWISPFVFSCYVTLREKGVPFEIVEVALDRKETQRPDYVAHTVTAKVPALVHDGFWLAESLAILEYLEEQFPSPRALPADVRERARARQVLSFLRTDLNVLRDERPTTTMFYARAEAPLTAAGQAAADKLIAIAERLLEGRTSLFSAWSIADADLAFMLQRLGLNGHDLGPRLGAFVEAQWARPSVQSYVERHRPAYVPY
jgi:glutathione S-transferase